MHNIHVDGITRKEYTNVSHGRIIHIYSMNKLYVKGIKKEKGLFDTCKLYSHVDLQFPGRVRDNVSTVQRTETRTGQEWVSGNCHVTPYKMCPWCNSYRHRKWTRRHEFKSWTRLIAFLIALIPLGKVWIWLFSLQLWVNSRAD